MLKIVLTIAGGVIGLVIATQVFPMIVESSDPNVDGEVELMWPLLWAGCTAIGATAGYWIARGISRSRNPKKENRA